MGQRNVTLQHTKIFKSSYAHVAQNSFDAPLCISVLRRPNQNLDVVRLLEQAGSQMAANETGRSGQKNTFAVRHEQVGSSAEGRGPSRPRKIGRLTHACGPTPWHLSQRLRPVHQTFWLRNRNRNARPLRKDRTPVASGSANP